MPRRRRDHARVEHGRAAPVVARDAAGLTLFEATELIGQRRNVGPPARAEECERDR